MVLLRTAFLGLAFLGYFLFFNKKGLDIALAPIVVLSAIGSVVFFAGLLNIMPLTAYLIVIAGIVLFFCAKPWQRTEKSNLRRTAVILGIYALFGLFLALRLYRQIPIEYDCFSHWLTVVKEMIRNDRMPNFQSATVMFQGYPTGSAGFIYFICKIIGKSRDDLIVFSQAVLIISAVIAPLAFIRKFNVSSALVFIGWALFCLVANIPINELLVDTLVSVLSLAAIAVVLRYRDMPRKAGLCCLPIQIFLITVKNSGILMVFINCIFLFLILWYTNRGRKKTGECFKAAGINAFFPFATYYLWLQHVKYVFPQGMVAKHTASVENYTGVLGEKTAEQISGILNAFFKRFFSWNNAWLYLAVFFLILCVCFLYRRKASNGDSVSREALIFVAILLAYFGFMAVLSVMYLVSMPYDEAIILASYERYEYTVLIVLVGCIVLYTLCTLQTERPKAAATYAGRILLVLLAAVIFATKAPNVKRLFVKENHYEQTDRYCLEQIKARYQLPEGGSYIVVGDSVADDKDYHYFLSKYVFWTNNVVACTPENFKQELGRHQYLVLLNRSAAVDRFLEERGYSLGESAYKLYE